MGKHYYRPIYAVDYKGSQGSPVNSDDGNILGDNNNNTYKGYVIGSGSVMVYPAFVAADVPALAGKQIIAARAGHRHKNGGLFGVYNGWACSYLMIAGERQSRSKMYQQDGYSTTSREQLGPPVYKANLAPWSDVEISSMGTDVGAAQGDIGPNRDNRWTIVTESFIVLVYDEPVQAPTTTNSYPAPGGTISTSSVSFSARTPAPQAEQPVQAVFQVARDSAFTQDVRTFVGGLNASTDPASVSTYVSKLGKDSYTNLGPGKWYRRMKGRDYRGVESGWGATTEFTIQHAALPVPNVSAPTGTLPTPYGIRGAVFSSLGTGGRMVGATWQFSKNENFSGPTIEWTNRTTGFWTLEPGETFSGTKTVTYDAEPDPTVPVGAYGPKVSPDDPSQYLTQGQWYVRARATDAYGQSGAWGPGLVFQVSHRPVATVPAPSSGAAFDPAVGRVRWVFSDPWSGDVQSAYRLRVLTNDGLQVLYDSGKVFTAQPQAPMTISGYQQQVLKYELTLWDQDDVQSSTVTTSTFRASTSPIVTVPFPAAGEAIVSGQPAVSWTAQFFGTGVVQASARLEFFLATTGAKVWDSGTVFGVGTTIAPPKPVLDNLTEYRMALTVTDTSGLSTTLVRTFTTNFVRPEYVPSYADSLGYHTNGYVTVHFPAGAPDPFFYEWRIYRRRAGTSAWVYAGSVSDPDQRTFRDWLVAGGADFEYSVTQAATRFGSVVESEHNPNPAPVPILCSSYWIIVEGDEDLSIEVKHVTGDRDSLAWEMNDYNIVGGGRRRNYGNRIGKSGTLQVSVRHSSRFTMAEAYEVMSDLIELGRPLILRDPFGELTRIALGEMSRDKKAGAGAMSIGDLELSWTEVM